MAIRLSLTSLILFLFLNSGQSQEVSQTNAWYMYFGNHKLTDKVGLHTEYQWRRSGLVSDWQQSLARIGIDYSVSDKAMLTAGYGWIVSFPYGKQPSSVKTDEHRIWQQFILKQKLKSIGFQHRYRLEQRFLENAILDASGNRVEDGYRFRQRARYRVLASIPLTKANGNGQNLFAAFYEELFLGFGEGIGSNVLDQNRLYAGLGYNLSKKSNVQLGYLFHRVFKADGIRRENNHTLNVALTYNMDFRPTMDE